MRPRANQRSGLSVIEVLAVMTIIAVLLSLMLPAVARSREAARRSQCINNLRQLGLALQNYEYVYQVLPPGVVDTKGPIRDGSPGLKIGWLVQLLPFMEMNHINEMVDTRISVFAPENFTVASTRLNTLHCPSDPFPEPVGGRPASSYAGCHHDVEAPIDVDNHGVFFLNSRVSHDDLTDGSAYTIFVGEKRNHARDAGGWMAGTRATLRNTGTPIDGPDRDDPDFVGGFGSYHLDGANFAFGDGSVRFLSGRIDPAVYRLLGHRDDGEPINANAF